MSSTHALILIVATTLAAAVAPGPATAQRYDPRYPVCMQSWQQWGGTIIDCRYTSLQQCRATASGLSAMCLENPYWSGPAAVPAAPGRGRAGWQ